MTDSFLVVHRATIITQAARNKVPAMYPLRIHVMDGGLLSYGASNIDLFRRAAPYVDRILRGAKPAELPVQVPTKYEMTLNLKTANKLGLDVPVHLQTTRRRGDRITTFLLRCMSPLLAQRGHAPRRAECPLSGVKRTLRASERPPSPTLR
jgi:ABC-type uncharacterized transport system substrate-binding protein